MQYILTEEEYDNMVPKSELELKNSVISQLRKKFLKLNNTECIYDNKLRTYCDTCPLSKFSNKDEVVLCDLEQNYSKI